MTRSAKRGVNRPRTKVGDIQSLCDVEVPEKPLAIIALAGVLWGTRSADGYGTLVGVGWVFYFLGFFLILVAYWETYADRADGASDGWSWFLGVIMFALAAAATYTVWFPADDIAGRVVGRNAPTPTARIHPAASQPLNVLNFVYAPVIDNVSSVHVAASPTPVSVTKKTATSVRASPKPVSAVSCAVCCPPIDPLGSMSSGTQSSLPNVLRPICADGESRTTSMPNSKSNR